MKTILSHANLIDCVEPQVRPDTAVLIEDGRIRAILPSAEVDSSADDAQVIDLKGDTCFPASGMCISILITCRSTRCRSPTK
jgi:imidazolonepropionase-like amidohydrolase